MGQRRRLWWDSCPRARILATKPLCAWTPPALASEAKLRESRMTLAVDVPSATVPEWTYDALFAAERQSAARAKAFVSGRLIDHRLLRLVDPVRAVAGEFAANAVVQAPTPFTLTLSRTGPVVLLSVHDTSSQAPARRSVQAAMLEGGNGLNLMVRLCRTWGVTADANDGKSVWATFDIRLVGDRGWS